MRSGGWRFRAFKEALRGKLSEFREQALSVAIIDTIYIIFVTIVAFTFSTVAGSPWNIYQIVAFAIAANLVYPVVNNISLINDLERLVVSGDLLSLLTKPHSLFYSLLYALEGLDVVRMVVGVAAFSVIAWMGGGQVVLAVLAFPLLYLTIGLAYLLANLLTVIVRERTTKIVYAIHDVLSEIPGNLYERSPLLFISSLLGIYLSSTALVEVTWRGITHHILWALGLVLLYFLLVNAEWRWVTSRYEGGGG